MNSAPALKPSPGLIAKLKEIGFSKTFAEGDVILNENSFIKAIPFVTSGTIRVMRTDPDGREILLYYVQPGETCIMSFLGGIHDDTSKVKAIAEEATEILFIPIDKVTLLIREFPEWLDYIFRLYHRRFEDLLDLVNAVSFRKMDERVYDFLRRKAELSKTNTLNITHEQIAGELGTSRVVISRLLKTLEEEQRVKLERNRITLL